MSDRQPPLTILRVPDNLRPGCAPTAQPTDARRARADKLARELAAPLMVKVNARGKVKP
jgi:hypothetical protein